MYRHVGDRRRHLVRQTPRARVAVALSDGPIRRGERRDLEIGVLPEHVHEPLSDQARRSENADSPLRHTESLMCKISGVRRVQNYSEFLCFPGGPMRRGVSFALIAVA